MNIAKYLMVGVACEGANLAWQSLSPATHQWWVMLAVSIAIAGWMIAHDNVMAD